MVLGAESFLGALRCVTPLSQSTQELSASIVWGTEAWGAQTQVHRINYQEAPPAKSLWKGMSSTITAQSREPSVQTTTESASTLVLHHVVRGDQWRDLSSGAGDVHLSSSGGTVILDHLDLINKTSS